MKQKGSEFWSCFMFSTKVIFFHVFSSMEAGNNHMATDLIGKIVSVCK